MNKTTFLAALAAVVMSIPSCRKAPETMKISIFCDHIESVARQEKIPFAEAAKKIKEIIKEKGWQVYMELMSGCSPSRRNSRLLTVSVSHTLA